MSIFFGDCQCLANQTYGRRAVASRVHWGFPPFAKPINNRANGEWTKPTRWEVGDIVVMPTYSADVRLCFFLIKANKKNPVLSDADWNTFWYGAQGIAPLWTGYFDVIKSHAAYDWEISRSQINGLFSLGEIIIADGQKYKALTDRDQDGAHPSTRPKLWIPYNGSLEPLAEYNNGKWQKYKWHVGDMIDHGYTALRYCENEYLVHGQKISDDYSLGKGEFVWWTLNRNAMPFDFRGIGKWPLVDRYLTLTETITVSNLEFFPIENCDNIAWEPRYDKDQQYILTTVWQYDSDSGLLNKIEDYPEINNFIYELPEEKPDPYNEWLLNCYNGFPFLAFMHDYYNFSGLRSAHINNDCEYDCDETTLNFKFKVEHVAYYSYGFPSRTVGMRFDVEVNAQLSEPFEASDLTGKCKKDLDDYGLATQSKNTLRNIIRDVRGEINMQDSPFCTTMGAWNVITHYPFILSNSGQNNKVSLTRTWMHGMLHACAMQGNTCIDYPPQSECGGNTVELEPEEIPVAKIDFHWGAQCTQN